MLRVLQRAFDYAVKHGTLSITDCQGRTFRYGDGTGEPVEIRLTDKAIERHLTLDPELAVGEGYMHGRLRVETGSIYDFLHLMLSNLRRRRRPTGVRIAYQCRRLLRRLKQFNSTAIARRNVTYHYDVDPRIYRLFLDSGLNYSCAYFQSPNMNLEEAQLAKLRHLAVKLNLKSSHKVLDIGSGWGSLAIYLAKHFDVAVKGVTLSEEQLKVSRQRALREGVENRVHFEIQDYRELNEVFDRIVSVGMFEHVGVGQYPVYMDTIKRLLAEDGVALIHSIGRFEGPGATNPFIEKFIFPGGYIPALSEVVPVVESSGLLLTDVEIWRLHYAETLRIWRQRFMASRDEASDIMGEEFCRMWEFYLAGSEATFRFDGMMVFQIQLCRDQETLSLTRDYMFDREDELKASAVNF